MDALDLEDFHARYEGDGRRRQPFDPRMMVKILIYGYASGVFSSRKMARKLHEDVAFQMVDQIERNRGLSPRMTFADSDYASEAALRNWKRCSSRPASC